MGCPHLSLEEFLEKMGPFMVKVTGRYEFHPFSPEELRTAGSPTGLEPSRTVGGQAGLVLFQPGPLCSGYP